MSNAGAPLLTRLPSVVLSEGVSCSDQQLLPHCRDVRASTHELNQSICQLGHVGAHIAGECPQQVCEEGDGLDLGELEVHEDMPAVVSHLVGIHACGPNHT